LTRLGAERPEPQNTPSISHFFAKSFHGTFRNDGWNDFDLSHGARSIISLLCGHDGSQGACDSNMRYLGHIVPHHFSIGWVWNDQAFLDPLF